jgi:L-lactate dehydrogenase complex protein LldG
MSSINAAAVDLFTAKAKPVTIAISTANTLDEVLQYALEVCEKKDFCKLLKTGFPEKEGPRVKTLAGPGLDDKSWAVLSEGGTKKNFTMIREGVRNYLSGIDVTVSVGDLGIADTATTVIECEQEDARLATMICEVHVVALAKSKIVSQNYEAEDFLKKAFAKERNYTAFISGPSRTADIERVLTLGVHGPLELHVVLLEQ